MPTDFSRNAAQALRYAVPLARQMGGKITVLHVLDWPVIPATLGAAMTDGARITGTVKQALDKLAKATVRTTGFFIRRAKRGSRYVRRVS